VFPVDKSCQIELRAELPSSMKAEMIWSGEVTILGMPGVQGKSAAQLHLLLLISPFHIPWGFGCCSLFPSSGFVSTRDAPLSVFGDASLLPTGNVACSICCSWDETCSSAGDRHLILEKWSHVDLMRCNRPSASSCTWAGASPGINTGWGMKGLRAVLQRRTWGCWLMRSST